MFWPKFTSFSPDQRPQHAGTSGRRTNLLTVFLCMQFFRQEQANPSEVNKQREPFSTPPTGDLRRAGSHGVRRCPTLSIERKIKPRWTLANRSWKTRTGSDNLRHIQTTIMWMTAENVSEKVYRRADGSLSLFTKWLHITTKFNLISRSATDPFGCGVRGEPGARWVCFIAAKEEAAPLICSSGSAAPQTGASDQTERKRRRDENLRRSEETGLTWTTTETYQGSSRKAWFQPHRKTETDSFRVGRFSFGQISQFKIKQNLNKDAWQKMRLLRAID